MVVPDHSDLSSPTLPGEGSCSTGLSPGLPVRLRRRDALLARSEKTRRRGVLGPYLSMADIRTVATPFALYHGFSNNPAKNLVVVACRLPGGDCRSGLCRLVVYVRSEPCRLVVVRRLPSEDRLMRSLKRNCIVSHTETRQSHEARRPGNSFFLAHSHEFRPRTPPHNAANKTAIEHL